MRSCLIALLVACLCMLLAAPVMAQTEDEIVAKYLKKTEKKHHQRIGFVVLSGSYGRLHTKSDYNDFVSYNNGQVIRTDAQTGSPLEGIYRSKELNLGFGLMATPKAALTFGFNYWLEMGSSETGDYDLVQLGLGLQSDFELKSEVQVYGVNAVADYYFLHAPDDAGILKGVAVKLSGGGGYYFARWSLWEDYNAYNLDAAVYEPIQGKVSGSAPGFEAGLSLEVPVQLFGLVVEGKAKYFYLNFSDMKWYNDSNQETVVTFNGESTPGRVDLDYSGPRAHFGIKRYFSW